jgi:hypothetical protein
MPRMFVPWKQLIQFAPQIISLSRELLSRARGTRPAESLVREANPDDLLQRVAALEENERRQAELVDRMATQQAELTQAVVRLHHRLRWLSGGVLLLGAALLWQFFSR